MGKNNRKLNQVFFRVLYTVAFMFALTGIANSQSSENNLDTAYSYLNSGQIDKAIEIFERHVIAPGKKVSFSKLSTCSSSGSIIIVPSLSIKSTFFISKFYSIKVTRRCSKDLSQIVQFIQSINKFIVFRFFSYCNTNTVFNHAATVPDNYVLID